MKGRKVPPSAATPALPPLPVQTIIAEAVHQVVAAISTQTMYPDGSGGCAWYAAIGAKVAAEITGHPYAINAGSFRLQTSAADGGWGYEMNAEQPLIEDQEFHAVLLRKHPGGRFEVADLASRHWRTWAKRLGAQWDAPDPPDFIWCFDHEVRAQWPLGISYIANKALTEKMIRRFTADTAFAATLDELTAQALQIANTMAEDAIAQAEGRDANG
jgi:hypothetical protein